MFRRTEGAEFEKDPGSILAARDQSAGGVDTAVGTANVPEAAPKPGAPELTTC